MSPEYANVALPLIAPHFAQVCIQVALDGSKIKIQIFNLQLAEWTPMSYVHL